MDSTRFTDSDTRLSLKEVIQTLPKAGEGNIWADNEFVTSDDAIDTDALRDIQGSIASNWKRSAITRSKT